MVPILVGFSLLPGGYREETGAFVEYINDGTWWSSTAFDGNNAWMRGLRTSIGKVGRNTKYKNNGCSIRCLKN
jgi:uncharacterized protein (TIGR02145 family)